MREILPGLYHWKTYHEGVGEDVHSYYVAAGEVPYVIDPRVPRDGLAWFAARKPPQHAYLTNRHHYRQSDQFEKAFGTKVWCHAAGMHEFVEGEHVSAFQHGQVLPGGVQALAIGALCPEETAFLIPLGRGVLAIGDAIISWDHHLDFVPDMLMGDDPEGVKRGLREAFRKALREQRFDTLLFAHGEPWVEGARTALREFVGGE